MRSLFRAGLLLVLLLPLGCTSHHRDQNPDQYASAEDCEIIAEVGKAELNWDGAGDQTQFVPNWPGYVEDCPWKALGVNPQLTAFENHTFATISRPSYSGDIATSTFNLVLPPPHGKFVYLHICKLIRNAGHWRLEKCDFQLAS